MPRTMDFSYAPDTIQTCIGLVDDPHKTIVREDGSLNYDYEEGVDRPPAADYRPKRDTLGFSHRLKPTFCHRDTLIERTQEYGDPGEAIVTTTEEYEETIFEWTVFAYRDEDCRADVIRWSLTAKEGFDSAPSWVELGYRGTGEDVPTIHASPESGERPEDTAAQAAANADEYAHAPGGPPLVAGDTREGVFAVVLDGDLIPERVTTEWADDALAVTREYWRAAEPFENEFRVPDEDVAAMLTACGRNILQAREEHDGVVEYQVGPTMYRGLWIVDGHFLLEAAHLLGRGETAFEQGLLALSRRVKPSGAIQAHTTLKTHYKETGIAFATIVRQCELAGDDDRLRELWPTMCRGLEFLEALRADAETMGTEYEAQHLFPPAMLDGGIAGPYPDYTTPLWVLAGLRYAIDAGNRLDLLDTDRFERLYEDVREAVEIYAERDRRETAEGIAYLPMNMTERAYDRPQSATWALAHAIYPGEVFDPDHRIVREFLDLLDSIHDEQGIPKETGWIHDDGVWTYSAAFYAHVWLYAGCPEKAIDYLYAFGNHAAPSRVWREEQPLADSHAAETTGDMPHNWASAEFIRLVRDLLVFERGERLELLPGLPAEWLPTDTDDPLALEATPTKFGAVDLRLEPTDEGYSLSYSRAPGSRNPDRVCVHWDGEVVEESAEKIGENTWLLPDGPGAELTLSR